MKRHSSGGHLGEKTTEHSSKIHHGRQDRQGDDAGNHARDDEVAEGIDGRRFKRIDLLGHTHRPKLGANAGADAARQQQPRGKRSRLSYQRDRETGRNHRFGAESFERRAGVHR